MNTMKAILFTLAMMISVYAGAVEFGQYRPAGQPVTTTSGGVGYSPATKPSVSFRSTSSYVPVTTLNNNHINRNDESGAGVTSRGPRRINGDGTGEYEGEFNGDKMWDGEEWVAIPLNQTRDNNGTIEIWNGTAWVPLSHQKDPDQPIGAMPWMLMLLLCGVYAAAAAYRRREA